MIAFVSTGLCSVIGLISGEGGVSRDVIIHVHFDGILHITSITVNVMLVMCSCLLYTSPSPRDATLSRMPSSA